MATLARRLSELDLATDTECNLIRSFRTKKSDIIEKDLLVAQEMEPVSLPIPYQQAVLKMYRREVISADRAFELLWNTFEPGMLPDLPPRPEAEIWAVTS